MKKKADLRKLADLFLTFFRIGLFTFGGGYAMIAVIDDLCVEKKKWITADDMTQVTVIAESTPGPIAINCATYTGYAQAGIPGSVAATLGVVLPSFIIIYLISLFLENLMAIGWIGSAFRGIRLAVGLLIIDAAVRMFKKAEKKPLFYGILAVSFVLMLLKDLLGLKFSTIPLMLIVAAFSLVLYFITHRKAGEGK